MEPKIFCRKNSYFFCKVYPHLPLGHLQEAWYRFGMKKVLFIFALFALSFGITHATVGGPTYLSDLKYNPADSSIYFTYTSHSGKGCPPELLKLSVITEEITTIVSCDESFELSEDDRVIEFLGVTAPLKDLVQIDLSTNAINMEFKYVKTETIPGDPSYILRTHFVASVFQNGELVDQFPFTACGADQPLVVGGYAIPSLTKKIALLLSTKGDCFEGGYIGESLHVISNVTVYDRTPAGPQKAASALPQSSATLIYNGFQASGMPASVPAPSSNDNGMPIGIATRTPDMPVPQQNNTSQIVTAFIAAAFLIIGVALGYHARKD
jgi:hypothetical protein